MLVMVVFFIAFRWIHLSTPLIRLFLLVLILLLMPTLNFLPVWFALSLLRFRLRLKVDRKSGSAGMPRPISYAVFCLKKKKIDQTNEYALLLRLGRQHKISSLRLVELPTISRNVID